MKFCFFFYLYILDHSFHRQVWKNIKNPVCAQPFAGHWGGTGDAAHRQTATGACMPATWTKVFQGKGTANTHGLREREPQAGQGKLSALPVQIWVSCLKQAWFWHHWPEEAARHGAGSLGCSLAAPSHLESRVNWTLVHRTFPTPLSASITLWWQ